MQAAARVLLPVRWGYFSREGGHCLPALPEQSLGWVLAVLGAWSWKVRAAQWWDWRCWHDGQFFDRLNPQEPQVVCAPAGGKRWSSAVSARGHSSRGGLGV